MIYSIHDRCRGNISCKSTWLHIYPSYKGLAVKLSGWERIRVAIKYYQGKCRGASLVPNTRGKLHRCPHRLPLGKLNTRQWKINRHRVHWSSKKEVISDLVCSISFTGSDPDIDSLCIWHTFGSAMMSHTLYSTLPGNSQLLSHSLIESNPSPVAKEMSASGE